MLGKNQRNGRTTTVAAGPTAVLLLHMSSTSFEYFFSSREKVGKFLEMLVGKWPLWKTHPGTALLDTNVPLSKFPAFNVPRLEPFKV